MERRGRGTWSDGPGAGRYKDKAARRGEGGARRAIHASAFGWWGESACGRELAASRWRRRSSASRVREDCARGRGAGSREERDGCV